MERPFTRTQGDVPPEETQAKTKEKKSRPKPTGETTASTSVDQSAVADLAQVPTSQAHPDASSVLPAQQTVDPTAGPSVSSTNANFPMVRTFLPSTQVLILCR